MTGFSYQLKIVNRLKVPEGISRRYNCPFCGGYNTLGVSNINGTLEWHCFRASCDAKGIYHEGGTIDGLKARLSNENFTINSLGAPIPELLTTIVQPEHIAWLKSVNSYEALKTGVANIFYSPAADRILFSLDKGKGYTGRRLDYKLTENGLIKKDRVYGPKWIKYGDTSNLFTCGTGPIGVLVEDAPSACAVGVLPAYTGLSLLGTNLTSSHKVNLFKYKSLLVCLDPDAASKSLDIASNLNGIRPTKVVLIPDDLKWYSPYDITQILEQING